MPFIFNIKCRQCNHPDIDIINQFYERHVSTLVRHSKTIVAVSLAIVIGVLHNIIYHPFHSNSYNPIKIVSSNTYGKYCDNVFFQGKHDLSLSWYYAYKCESREYQYLLM